MWRQIRRVGRFLERVASWLPVLWKCEDWDYSTLLFHIQHQVGRFAEVQRRYKHAAGWSERVLECDKLRHLIELVHEDPADEWDAHFHEWAHVSKPFNKPCKGQNLHAEAMRLSTAREERNWHNVWQHLDVHLRKWWD